MSCAMVVFGFFFQAEDGIRDRLVTGVQTCALPIFQIHTSTSRARHGGASGVDNGSREEACCVQHNQKCELGVEKKHEKRKQEFTKIAVMLSRNTPMIPEIALIS